MIMGNVLTPGAKPHTVMSTATDPSDGQAAPTVADAAAEPSFGIAHPTVIPASE